MSYQNGIINHLIENEITITFLDNSLAPITQENIVSESMTLKQSVCDGEELRFGGCIASEFSIRLMNTPQRQFNKLIEGKWISVKITQRYAAPDAAIYPANDRYPSNSLYPGITVGEKEFYIFSGYIDSATVDKTDKNFFDVVAYDALAKLYETDATDYFYRSVKTIMQLTSLISYIGQRMEVDRFRYTHITNEAYTTPELSTEVGNFNAKNTEWLNRKDRVSYGALLRQICEVLGVFGVVLPNEGKGIFTMRKLTGTPEVYRFYEKLEAEEFQATGYTDFQFNVSGDDRTGKSVTAVGGLSDRNDSAIDKVYDFSDNILIMQPYAGSSSGRTSSAFDYLINRTSIGTRLAMNAESTAHSGQCAYSDFQPLSATLDGRLWVSVGDPIEILVSMTDVNGDYILDENGNIQKETVKTYLLSRTLTGIQALTDQIEAKGLR